MPDPRDSIQRMFDDPNRFANFGNVIIRMHVQGFRCHANTLIEVASPITALCGLNGTGKSTLLQLAATAYRTPMGGQRTHFNISDFMVIGTLDPTPFTEDARVEYRYWQSDRRLKQTTVSRNAANQRWSGYGQRLQRQVFFTGVGHYLPRIEKRDFVTQHANKLVVTGSEAVADEVKTWTSKTLACNYDNITNNRVTYTHRSRQQTGDIVCVERYGVTYSEAHMGYGEGRTQYLVSTLESLPPKCLILIEEPETSLHPSAQYQLGQYLVDVVKRKKHQIFLTTHSMFLLNALPSSSALYLKRDGYDIKVIPGLSPLQIRSLLAEGHEKALNVLVEDEVAQAVLREMILRIDRDFLRTIDIHPVGDADTIAQVVRSLLQTRVAIACVRDADKGSSPKENIFKLPGSSPPEKELLAHQSVKIHIQTDYGVNLDDFAATLTGVDHHDWFDRLAHHVNQNKVYLISETARVYARGLPELEVDALVTQLKEAARQ